MRNLLETVAVGAAVKDAELTLAKRGLPVGKHNVNMLVRIVGVVNKFEDTQGVIAQRAEPWALLAAALNRLNGVSIEKVIEEAEAIAKDEVRLAALKAKTAEALKRIKGEVTGPISGQTRANLAISVLESGERTALAVA